ncbi:MAG: RAMP superfamily CRISPR-associated protein, partial [Cyanobacteriota bacterium]
MYNKAYGVIETLAPVHIGATAGEETGNLNLIFRDQFIQTGIIPGSSIRGRLRSEMRLERQFHLEQELEKRNIEINESANQPYLQYLERLAKDNQIDTPKTINEKIWYGHESVDGQRDGGTTEAYVKFEYASLIWFPVFCPGQPVVWVSCPALLKRYKRIAGISADVPEPYTAQKGLQGRQMEDRGKILFFNLGFLEIEHQDNLSAWIPTGTGLDANKLVVVDNNDI